MNRKLNKKKLGTSFVAVDILSSTDVYYGVRGHIIGLTGLQETVSHAYIKVKLFRYVV